MEKIRWLINVVLLLILLDLIILGYFYILGNPFEGPKQFRIKNSDTLQVPLGLNLSNEVTQFYPNMRYNHNELSFYIDPGCQEGKRIRMLQAFLIINSETGILSFYPSSSLEADIIVDCTNSLLESDDTSFIVGEGGPSKIINSSLYPIILQGKIILYNESSCSQPVTELHELLHVLGFDHMNDPEKILYPYLGCNQTMDSRIVENIKQLYALPALPELYFLQAEASKTNSYLNFNVQVNNQGIVDAEEVTLKVYEDSVSQDNEVGSFNLKIIKMGEGKSLEVTNLKLPSRATKNIILKVETNSEEYDLKNNEITITI
ncbi:hypothetical protein FJZ17_02790 [Candidatus Pacearchaeota archaeon]|nr:hypothetical protein [Candidatus Pacearchaeota archaeon]